MSIKQTTWLLCLALALAGCNTEERGRSGEQSPAPLLLDEQPGAAEPHIQLLLSGGVAGLALHVNALDIPLATGTPLTAQYDWDFGDPKSPFNRLSGWNAAHLYSRAGDYTITLTLTEESGRVRKLKALVEIDPSRRITYYVAESGSDVNEGTDPEHPIRSLNKVAKLVANHTQFMFHRGETFGMTSQINIPHKDVVFGAYNDLRARDLRSVAARTQPPATGPATHPSTLPLAPPDDRPRIVWVGPRQDARMLRVMHNAGDVTIQDLTFDTVFRDDTDNTHMPSAIDPGGTNVAVMHCRFLNLNDAINAETSPTGLLVENCDAPQIDFAGRVLETGTNDTSSRQVTGLCAYFTWLVGDDIVLLGNTVANSTREHCVRISGGHRILVAYNDLQNLDRTSVDKQDIAKGTIAAQVGDHLYATHNILRGGPTGAGPLNRADLVNDPKRRQDAFSWAVFDGNTYYCAMILQPGLSHAMIRNNICFRDTWGAFLINGYEAGYSRGVSDATFLHNTVINNSSRGNFLVTTGKADEITVENNLFIAPNLAVADGTGALLIREPDLTSFKSIRNNVWPVPAKFSNNAHGGINSLSSGFQSPAIWGRDPKVAGERCLRVALDEKERPTAPVDVPLAPGARFALDGTRRGPTTDAGAMTR